MIDLEKLSKILRSEFLKIGIYKKADMAQFLGYRSPYFSGIINGKEKMTDQFLKNISEKLNINIEWIKTEERESNDISIRNNGTVIKGENISNTQVAGRDINSGKPVVNRNQLDISTLQQEIRYLNMIIAEKDKLLTEKDRMIEILINKRE